jgi:anti-anti-sigma factor
LREVTLTCPQRDPFAVSIDITAGTATAVISGELDVAGVPLLAQHLAQILDEKPQRLVLDMAQVGFMDCAAARTIASTGRCLPEGRRPVIRSPSSMVRRILELSGLDAHVEQER